MIHPTLRQQAQQRIAGLLYDGVLSPPDWYGGLDAIREVLGAGTFHFFTMRRPNSLVLESVDNQGEVGINADKMRDYEAHYLHDDVRMAALLRLSQGQIMLDHEHISAREMSRNSVYADILKPFGFRHTLGATLRDDGVTRDVMGFMRPVDHTPYGASDKSFIEQLLPDLIRATHLRARASELVQKAALGMATLDTLSQGIAVIDGQCRIQYANSAAERLMVMPSVLTALHGRLQCTHGALQTRLQQLVTEACASPSRAGALDLRASKQYPARLVLTVLPLKLSHSLSGAWQLPRALIVLSSPGAATAMDPGVISDLLGLSPCETRLLLLLAAGQSVKDFAAVEDCSWHTARTHIKNLMHKTGCHKQLELIQLLQSLQLG